MKVTGIIAEYNPFHHGHAYHLSRAREMTDADYIVVVMSGDFTQRGAPALLDKYLRCEMALKNGADLVLELPLPAATGSAEFFAEGAVSLLHHLGAVDALVFGSECGDLGALQQAALLYEQPEPHFQAAIGDYLKQGLSFPAARARALASRQGLPPETAALLASPNNILGIEYCRALLRLQSPIRPFTLARKGAGYHDASLQSVLPSATAIRTALREEAKSTSPQVPSRVLAGCMSDNLLPLMDQQAARNQFLYEDDFSALLHMKLLQEAMPAASGQSAGLTRYADVTPALSDKIRRQTTAFSTWTQLCAALKTRDLTYARISRSLCHILLDLTTEDYLCFRCLSSAPYARILGFRREALPLLGRIRQETSLPLLSKLADAPSLLTEEALPFFKKDIYASHLYQSVRAQKSGRPFQNEYTHGLVLLP